MEWNPFAQGHCFTEKKNNWIKLTSVGESMALYIEHRVKEHYLQPV